MPTNLIFIQVLLHAHVLLWPIAPLQLTQLHARLQKFLSGDKLCAQLGICQAPALLLLSEQGKNTAAKYGRLGSIEAH